MKSKSVSGGLPLLLLNKIGKKKTEQNTKTIYQCRWVLDMHPLCQQAMAVIHHLESHLKMNEIPYLKGSSGHKFWQVSNDLVLVRKKCFIFGTIPSESA